MRAGRVLVAFNVLLLVATSYPEFYPQDTDGPFEVELSPEQPVLFIYGDVQAGEPVGDLALTLTFAGNAEAPIGSSILVYEVPEDATEIPQDAIQVGQAMLTTGEIDGRTDSTSRRGPFALAIELVGDAEFVGTLELTASGYSSQQEGSWIDLDMEIAP